MDPHDLTLRAHQSAVAAQVSPGRHPWQSQGSRSGYLSPSPTAPCSLDRRVLVGDLPLALFCSLESQPLARDTIPLAQGLTNLMASLPQNDMLPHRSSRFPLAFLCSCW